MSAGEQWAPPGMPGAAARARLGGRSVLLGLLGFLAFGVVFAVVRGVRADTAHLLWVGALVAGVAAWLSLQQSRTELSAGPGWLAVRGLLRRRWVRTDQLRSVQVHRPGFERVLTLRDTDGRKVAVLLSDLRLEPRLQRTVAQDVRTSLEAGAEVPPEGRSLLLEGA